MPPASDREVCVVVDERQPVQTEHGPTTETTDANENTARRTSNGDSDQYVATRCDSGSNRTPDPTVKTLRSPPAQSEKQITLQPSNASDFASTARPSDAESDTASSGRMDPFSVFMCADVVAGIQRNFRLTFETRPTNLDDVLRFGEAQFRQELSRMGLDPLSFTVDFVVARNENLEGCRWKPVTSVNDLKDELQLYVFCGDSSAATLPSAARNVITPPQRHPEKKQTVALVATTTTTTTTTTVNDSPSGAGHKSVSTEGAHSKSSELAPQIKMPPHWPRYPCKAPPPRRPPTKYLPATVHPFGDDDNATSPAGGDAVPRVSPQRVGARRSPPRKTPPRVSPPRRHLPPKLPPPPSARTPPRAQSPQTCTTTTTTVVVDAEAPPEVAAAAMELLQKHHQDATGSGGATAGSGSVSRIVYMHGPDALMPQRLLAMAGAATTASAPDATTTAPEAKARAPPRLPRRTPTSRVSPAK